MRAGRTDQTCAPQTSAIREALKNLFREERLPDNPYFFLASVLGAYVDQSPLWKMPATDIAAAYDLEGGVEVVDYDTKLCRVVEHPAFGLPHVLRLVSKDGEGAAGTGAAAARRSCWRAQTRFPLQGALQRPAYAE